LTGDAVTFLLLLTEAFHALNEPVPLCHLRPELRKDVLENCRCIVGNGYTLSLAQAVNTLAYEVVERCQWIVGTDQKSLGEHHACVLQLLLKPRVDG
jgi:hypothetical protein